MKISGTVEFAASATRASKAIQREEHLAHFLPGGAKLSQRLDGGFDFIVQKDIGPVALRLPGVLTVAPDPAGNDLLFRAKASHVLGGSADLNLTMGFAGDAARCRITYDGTLEATGLAGKAMALGAEKIQDRIQSALQAFGRRLEKGQKAHDARLAEKSAARG